MRSVYYPRCMAVLSVVFDGRGGIDSRPLFIQVVPKAATVNFNGYNEADTWSLEFDARALPLDPDLIRSAAVEIYMYAADGNDDREGTADPADRVIVGLADTAELELSGGSYFRMDGRDYTALMLDKPWSTTKRKAKPGVKGSGGKTPDKLKTSGPLDDVVQAIIDEHVTTGVGGKVLRVVFDSDVPAPAVSDGYRVGKKKSRAVKGGKSVWDVIYELCARLGFLVYVQGEEVIITEPRIQTAKSLSQAPKMAYGRNLRTLRARRKLGKERIPQVVIQATDHKTGAQVEGIYPKDHESPTTGIGTLRDEVTVIPAPRGVTDRRVLERMARTRYENLARSEAEYAFETKHLRDLEDRNLLWMRSGSPVMIGFDAFNAEQMRQLTAQQRQEHLIAMGYSAQVAAFVASNYDRINQFQQPYYVKAGSFDWANGDGLSISAEVMNYAFVPREEAEAA